MPQIGEFGRYQKLLIWLVCLPACIPCGFGAFNQLFMQQIPDHWCKVPELNHLSPNERRLIAIPNVSGTPNRLYFFQKVVVIRVRAKDFI